MNDLLEKFSAGELLEFLRKQDLDIFLKEKIEENEQGESFIKEVIDVDKIQEEYLKSVLDGLAQKWDCDYRIVSLSKGYESSPESGFLSILENATLRVLGKTREEVQLLPFVSMGSSDGRFLVDSRARV